MNQIFKDKQDFITQYRAMVRANTGKEFELCGSHDRFYALAELIATRARRIASENELEIENTGQKRRNPQFRRKDPRYNPGQCARDGRK